MFSIKGLFTVLKTFLFILTYFRTRILTFQKVESKNDPKGMVPVNFDDDPLQFGNTLLPCSGFTSYKQLGPYEGETSRLSERLDKSLHSRP